MRILAMEEGHLDDVLRIEFESFSSPWTRSFFRKTMRDERCRAIVLLDGGTVAGFAVFWSIGRFAELGDIAVDPSLRRRGIGRRLLDGVVTGARLLGATMLLLEVRVSNTPAIDLYRKAGFRRIQRRRDYYVRPVEDALVLGLDLEGRGTHEAGNSPSGGA